MIDRPVFILGTGRCGSTLFFDLLAAHPAFGWISNYTNHFPRLPALAALSRLRDLPLRPWTVEPPRPLPIPVEAYRALNYLTDSRFTQPRVLTADDVTEEARARFRRFVAAHLRLQGKDRFLHKHTGFARVHYLSAIFPDALFIHVYRDGRAVANSMYDVPWWTPENAWRWGEMPRPYADEYHAAAQDPVLLAGLIWKRLMELIEEECSTLPPSRMLNVRYDHLVARPHETMQEALAFCGLPSHERLERAVQEMSISNMDRKWEQKLPERQRALLEQSLRSHLERYGFAS